MCIRDRDMVTTSSCSGRISVFAEGVKDYKGNVKVGGKGQGGKWLYVSHDSDKVRGWIDTLNTSDQEIISGTVEDNLIASDGSTRYLLYKYEPFILHVKCRNFEMASRLYNVAMACGFRESGIGSNNLVAVRINIKLDVPIGFVDDKEKLNLFVSPNYIQLLDKLTLTKFEENEKKMKELYVKIENQIINGNPIASLEAKKEQETKEERRERKRREGLERQRKAKDQKAAATD